MGEELRFYLMLDSATEKSNDELLKMSIEDFVNEVEQQGNVYSLSGFIKTFNEDEGLSLGAIIRVAIVCNGKILKEVK